MIQLQTLGSLNLQRDGVEVRSVLSQPKRLALLVFLATAQPRGFLSRDKLLGLFWPEADDAAARNALRQALHYLRRSLGEATITSRTERDVGIDPQLIWCDAAAFDVAIDERRYADALELYRGEFLSGFFTEDAPDIERWIDEERTRRRRQAVDAAWALAQTEEDRGELRTAVLWARKAIGLVPYDEAAARRLVTLLDRAGESGAAIEAFEEFERRLSAEYGITPSDETRQQIEAIRARRHAPAPAPVVVYTAPQLKPIAPAEPISVPAAAIEVQPQRPTSKKKFPWKRVAAALVIEVALVAAGWLTTSSLRRPRLTEPAVDNRAIAVLPFVNMSEDASNEYFSDGITEEILNSLVQVDGLRIASRTSSFAYKGQQNDVREIGRKLGVGVVLEGSVRKSGDRVKITAQLVKVTDGYHLWSKTFDREVTDIFAVQEEIAHAITNALALQFSAEDHEEHARRSTKDAKAYDLYLRGKYLISIASQEKNARAIEYFGQAAARDPHFSLAYAGLAKAHMSAAEFVPPRQVLPRAKMAAMRALQLDSTLVETRLALSEVRQVYDRDWQAAEYEIKRAIALQPGSADAHAAYANLLLDSRRYEEARKEREFTWQLRAEQVPDSSAINFRVDRHVSWSSFYWITGDSKRAMDESRAALALDPSNPTAHVVLASVLLEVDRPAEAVREMEKVRQLTNNGLPYLTHLGRAYAAVGRTTEARALLDTLNARSATQYVGKDQIALLSLALGDTAGALTWLERAVDDFHWWMPNSNYHPLWRGLWEQPRFKAMMRTIGAP